MESRSRAGVVNGVDGCNYCGGHGYRVIGTVRALAVIVKRGHKVACRHCEGRGFIAADTYARSIDSAEAL